MLNMDIILKENNNYEAFKTHLVEKLYLLYKNFGFP